MQRSAFLTLGLLLSAVAGCGSDEPRSLSERNQADFVNGGFEAGDLSGWTVTTGINNNIPTFPPMSIANLGLAAGGVNLTSAKMGVPIESQIPNGLTAAESLRYPRFGKYSAVVNEGGNNHNSNTLTQTLTTTQADVDALDGNIHVRFALAPVLQNPNPPHLQNEQPYFYIDLKNTTSGASLFSSFNFSGQVGIPFKSDLANTALYTDWQLFDVAPGPTKIAIGDTLQMTIIASGCAFTQHFGEIYIDGFGTYLPGLSVVGTAPTSANSGTDLTYTFVAKNGSDVTADSTVFSDLLPIGTTFVSVSPGLNCSTPAVGAAGTVRCNLGSINPAAAQTFQVTVHIAPAAVGPIVNGTYTIQAQGVTPIIGPAITTAVTTGVVYTDLGVTVSDGAAALDWGSPDTYTVVVTNNGPAAVNGAMITNMVPAKLTGVTWTCAGANNGTCGAASGSGALNTTANLPVGASVTYTVTGNVVAGSGSGFLSYLVNVAPPAGTTDPSPLNNTGVDTDNIGPVVALTVDKGQSSGTGSITSAPAAIRCGANCTTQTANFASGSTVTLTAVAAPGSIFTGWTGACAAQLTAPLCTVTLSAAQTVSANFSLPSYAITTTVVGGNGTITCPTPILQGTSAACTVTPAPGYELDTLTGDGNNIFPSVNNNGFSIDNVQGPRNVQGTFKKSLGNGCGAAGECHSGFCANSGVCCDQACESSCGSCNQPGLVGICSPACGGFACDTALNTCYSSCTTDDQCVTGGTCAGGTCLPPAAGQYNLSGGGISGCEYSGPNSSSMSAHLAILAMLAFMLRRRRSLLGKAV